MTPGAQLRTLRHSERPAFLALMEAAFDVTFMFDLYLQHDPQLGDADTLVATVDDRIVSAVQIFTRTIRLRGREVRLGGIGSVATHPDHERKGFATELLRRAIEEMQRREMAISLLFAERITFYARLDWVEFSHRVRVLHRGGDVKSAGFRPFAEQDLTEVKALYADYCKGRDLTTCRDDAYWAGQLVFAGNPAEDFRVCARDGLISAYARVSPFQGILRVIECARIEDGAGDLAALLLSMTPAERPVFLPDAGDEALLAALDLGCGRLDEIAFPGQMWRVLDRPLLADLDDEGGAGDDAALLGRLVSNAGSVFWPSDRF